AFMAAARKGEQKQKVKEDRLAKILLKFIQSNQKSTILMLAARLLEENIPASFILSIIILGNEEVQKEIKAETHTSLPQLAPGESPAEFSLITRFSDESVPLKIKAEIDSWGKGIFESGSATPFRVLETALTKEGEVKKVVIDCAANVLGDYLEASNFPTLDYETFYSFCEFLMQGIAKALKKQIENQKELHGGDSGQ
ncbi:MAG: hypothetical protein AAB606_01335, partial [Patescibacteria group bacterium]